ncbi:MAG: ABC transporter ATP-binding protein [Victivallales bacterium]|jgi:branched-chain amino acid transport system ATP-binding protein
MRKSDKIEKEFKQFYAEGVCKKFGGLQAVDNFSMELDSGEIVGIIGPNGAGKTTVFNLITGMESPDSGKIYFEREYIDGEAPHEISKLGIARTFQNIRLLDYLTVLDNIKIAYHRHISYNIIDASLRLPKYFSVEKEITDKSIEFLRIFGLEDSAYELASALPYGKRRKLEIARALATEATLLLLDEPAAGLNPRETSEITELIRKIRNDFHLSILLIEHDMNLVMNLCERVIVLNFGKVIAQGTPEEVKNNKDVIEAYLGTGKAG